MTRSFPRSLAATLGVLCIVLASCGDDDPVAVDDPCDDAGTTCSTVRLTTAEMSHVEVYDNLDDETSYVFSWDIGSDVIRGYAPGERVMVTVSFDPPLEVRYNHSFQNFILSAGVPGTSFDRLAEPTTSLDNDDWTVIVSSARCMGEFGTGASRLDLAATFGPLVTGESLRRLAFDFIVPDTYTSGSASGTPILPGDLDVFRLELITIVPGDTTNDPPIWQGEFEP